MVFLEWKANIATVGALKSRQQRSSTKGVFLYVIYRVGILERTWGKNLKTFASPAINRHTTSRFFSPLSYSRTSCLYVLRMRRMPKKHNIFMFFM